MDPALDGELAFISLPGILVTWFSRSRNGSQGISRRVLAHPPFDAALYQLQSAGCLQRRMCTCPHLPPSDGVPGDFLHLRPFRGTNRIKSLCLIISLLGALLLSPCLTLASPPGSRSGRSAIAEITEVGAFERGFWILSRPPPPRWRLRIQARLTS